MFEKEIQTLQEVMKMKSEERNKVLENSVPSIAEADYLEGYMYGIAYAIAMLEQKKLQYERSGIETIIKIGLNSKFGEKAAEEAKKNGYLFQPGFLEDFEKEGEK